MKVCIDIEAQMTQEIPAESLLTLPEAACEVICLSHGRPSLVALMWGHMQWARPERIVL